MPIGKKPTEKNNEPKKSEVILKEIISLENQAYVFVVENKEGVFLYRQKKVDQYTFSLRCRMKSCKKVLKVHPIHNVR